MQGQQIKAIQYIGCLLDAQSELSSEQCFDLIQQCFDYELYYGTH